VRGLLQESEGNEGVPFVEKTADTFPSDNHNSNDMSGSDASKDK
jgi:hypothetical protein